MDYEELEQQLLEFREEEIKYRKLYLANPNAYSEPINDWDDFVTRYRTSLTEEKDIPPNAPSAMGHDFAEKDWFPQKNREVTVVRNARYCPAFLHHLEFIKLIYVLRGHCILYVDNMKTEIHQGSFCLILPNIEQTIFSCSDEDIVLNIIMRRSTFSSAFSSLLTEQGILSDFFWKMLYSKNSNRVMLFSCKSDSVLDHVILDLYKEAICEQKPSNLLLKSFVLIFFGYVLRNHQEEIVPLGSVRESFYNLPNIVRYIKENLNHVTLVTLAEHFNMSEGYLSRYIRRETGYTFSYILRDIRMRQAAEMLRNSKCSVEEIIEVVGYTDASHFYKTFKEMYGMTPAMFRNREDIFII